MTIFRICSGVLLTTVFCLAEVSAQTPMVSDLLNSFLTSGKAAPTGTIRKFPPRNGYCLNLHNNLNTNGAVVNLWRCNGHQSQQWQMNADGTIRHAAFPNMCLNLHNDQNANGAVINLWSCTGHRSMQWRVKPDMTIRSASYPGMCLNLHNNAFSDGGMINLWTCNGHESQKWIVPTP